MNNFDFKYLLKIATPHLIAIAIFVFASIVYFYPQMQGKTIFMNDINQHGAMAQEVVTYQKETGNTALWTGSMFSGMPTFQLTAPAKNNLTQKIYPFLQMFFNRPIGYFIMGMVCFYIAMIMLGVSPLLSGLGAMMFVFATGNLSLFSAGHMSKLVNIFSSPPILAGIFLVFKSKYLKGFFLFSFFLALNIGSNHPQMSYYLALCIGVMFLIHAGYSIKNKQVSELGKQSAILLLGGILAISTSFSKLYTTYEYSKSTMRGNPVLTSNAASSNSSSTTKGLDWNYATNWSNGKIDLVASFIPYVVGGSDGHVLPDDSKLVRQTPTLKNRKLPVYWGGLDSTAGPFYFGAMVFFLFLLGAIVVQKPIKWFLLSAVALTFMLSLGRNFEFFNRFLFDYLPLFNKFRTPNSVLALTALFVPFLAILGLQEVLSRKDKESIIKPLFIAGGILSAICLFFVFLGSSMFDFNGKYDGQMGQLVPALKEARKDLMVSSSLKTLFFILAGVGGLYFYAKNKVKGSFVVGFIGVISLMDLMSVARIYISPIDFKNPKQITINYAPRSVDSQILQDPDPHYRVFDVANFGSAIPSYHHKTIGGYHPAKLQRYQDVIDYHISKNNLQVLDMLNTKYFIVGQENNLTVQRNPNPDGNVWFVKDVTFVNSSNEEIEKLNEVDPTTTAIVNNEFKEYIKSNAYSGNGTISLTEYSLNKLTYSSSSSEDNLAVFSEIWYEPGWQAYIDGKEVDHIRVNYLLRALNVPAGDHVIEFRFAPSSYKIGEIVSFVSSLFLLGFLGFMAFKYFKSLNNKVADIPVEKKKTTPKKKRK